MVELQAWVRQRSRGRPVTTLHDVALLRVVAQRLAGPSTATPAEAVRWSTAVQAQDHDGALTSVALRTRTRSRAAVVAALDAGEVVRSWPMRGTLHLTTAADLPGLIAMIAPFWGDVDTRPAQDPEFANGSKVVSYGQGHVGGRKAFGVNYVDLGYYSYQTDKLNSLQVILIERSDTGAVGNFDVEFNYNRVLWETGYASNGADGYGGSPARVGITNGVDRTIEAQYSGETIKQLDFTPSSGVKNYTTGLIYRKRNSTVPGRQVFQFRGGNLIDAFQVYAGPDYVSSAATSTSTPLATASDPSGGAITVQWSVLNTSSTTPVVITNATSLNATISYSLGSTTDMLLVVRRTSDPTISASDVMRIQPN